MAETPLQSAQRKIEKFNREKADLEILVSEWKRAANEFKPENTTNAATTAREQAAIFYDALQGMNIAGLLTYNEQTAINKLKANAKKSPSMFGRLAGLFGSSAPAASGSAGRPSVPTATAAAAAPASSGAYAPPAYTPPARGATSGVYINSKGRRIVDGGRRRHRLTKRRHTKRRKSRKARKSRK
jgi:hypothetical protein